MARRVWETYEIYVKFNSQPGKGIYRVWRNGKLIYENKSQKTLSAAASYSDRSHIFSYWNGIARVWKTPQGGTKTLIFERTDVKLYNAAGNFFERGYLLGWSNSGFLETTTLYIDNVTISNSPIQ